MFYNALDRFFFFLEQPEELCGVHLVVSFADGPTMKRRWCIDKDGIAVIIGEHWSSHQIPDVFVHKLELVQDEFIGIVTAK